MILSLSLSESLSLTLFYNSRESLKCCVVFSKRQEKKREKKNRRESTKLLFKNNYEKSERFSQQPKKQKKTENFSSAEFFIINSSLARKKERKKDAFSSGELPESGMYSSYITTHTQREREIFLSFSLCSFFVLLSFSSSAFCCFRRVSSLRLSL